MSQIRQKYIDIAAGIMILWMMLYHAFTATNCFCVSENLSWEIFDNPNMDPMQMFPWFSFFMPWFFYKAGMFFRRRNTTELFVYDCKKLLKPWLIWSIIGYLLYVIMSFADGSASFRSLIYRVLKQFILTGRFPLNLALWFLFSLFVIRNLFNLTINKIHPLIVACFGLLVAYIHQTMHSNYGIDWLGNVSAGLFYFSIGYYSNSINPRLMTKFGYVGLFCFVGYCVANYYIPNGSDCQIPIVKMVTNARLQGVYLLSYPVALCGVLGMNFFCKSLSFIINFACLEWIGRNAMPIYCAHYLFSVVPLWGGQRLIHITPILLFASILVSYTLLMLGVCICQTCKKHYD